MSDIVIKAENLGKKYTIGHQASNGRYLALRDVVMQNARSLWRTTRDLVRGKPIIQGDDLEEVWALKDVTFEIHHGEAIGIIGRNGAGKSTLLKVLSRITEPSAGRVTIKGRVASLLEVGTGFHPELTGRENIYLNGAILGMTRAEIKHKFDEIVDFSGIERFLDTPVKRYSSGMYVRLAFSVAAHLEPEILLVDEVLAVGDAAFQRKCLGRMGEVADEGRTVLFVSHNMGAINSLARSAILLENGCVADTGPASKITRQYLEVNYGQNAGTTYLAESRESRPRFIRAEIVQEGVLSQPFVNDRTMLLRIYINSEGQRDLVVSVHVQSGTGLCVHHSSDEFANARPEADTDFRLCMIPPHSLAPGQYTVDLYLGKRNYEMYDSIKGALAFEVVFNDSVSAITTGAQWKGACSPGALKWFWEDSANL